MIRTYHEAGSYDYYRALNHTRFVAFVLSTSWWIWLIVIPAIAGALTGFL